MNSATNELLALVQFIISERAVRYLWDDGVFAGLHVVPLLSKFLSIRHNISESNPTFASEESRRIGALLYLAGIRQRFGVNLAKDIYIPKLKHAIMVQNNSNLEKIKPVMVWLLVIGGVQSLMHDDHNWFVSATVQLILQLQYNNWEELMTTVREVSWVEGILEVECNKFCMEVSSTLWNSYGHFFS